MATKKIITTGLLAMLSAVGVAMNANNMNKTNNVVKAEETTVNTTNKLNLIAKAKNVNEEGYEVADATMYIINKIIENGPAMITGAVTAYAKTMCINLLKNYGIDLRDASIKYLERIENALGEIKEKLNIMEQKQEKYHAEEVLNDYLYEMFTDVEFNIKDKVYGSLYELACLELDDTIKEEDLEARRYAVYEALCKDYSLNTMVKQNADANGLGLETTLVSYATKLAYAILEPNRADTSKDIFYYYDNTIGLTDKWVGQQIKNRRNYIAYCTNMLITTVNLAEFDMHYRYQEKPAARATYDRQLEDMATYVNAVGEKFQKELIRLDELEKKMQEKHITTYLPTNTEYSTRMATLTYNPDDIDENNNKDSRQGLLLGAHDICGDFRDYDLAYHPNQQIIKNVTNDYKDYIDMYGTEDYTINQYLKDAGFYAVNEDLFDNAAGIYYGDMYLDRMGYMYHDSELTVAYYNQDGDYTRTPVYKLDIYHNWYGGVDHTDLQHKDYNYYLCFINANQNNLDGTYEAAYVDNVTKDISRDLFFQYKDITKAVYTTEFTVHDCW